MSDPTGTILFYSGLALWGGWFIGFACGLVVKKKGNES